jgi:transaldolase
MESNMHLYLDTGDIEEIKRAHDTGLLDGITTNPSHIAKTGRPFRQTVEEICRIVKGPVSVETMADDTAGMIKDAQQLAGLAPNMVIKIPMTPAGLKAVPVLEKLGVKTNVTMIFSPTQCFLAMKSGASYVSIVLSRLDAIAGESDSLVDDAVLIKQMYTFSAKIIAASLKTQNHVLSCLRAGIDIATLPESLFFQLYKHPLTDQGLDTFKKDWKKVTA